LLSKHSVLGGADQSLMFFEVSAVAAHHGPPPAFQTIIQGLPWEHTEGLPTFRWWPESRFPELHRVLCRISTPTFLAGKWHKSSPTLTPLTPNSIIFVQKCLVSIHKCNTCVTSDVQFRKGALIPSFWVVLGWADPRYCSLWKLFHMLIHPSPTPLADTRVSSTLKTQIVQARTAKKLTQAQLAQVCQMTITPLPCHSAEFDVCIYLRNTKD